MCLTCCNSSFIFVLIVNDTFYGLAIATLTWQLQKMPRNARCLANPIVTKFLTKNTCTHRNLRFFLSKHPFQVSVSK